MCASVRMQFGWALASGSMLKVLDAVIAAGDLGQLAKERQNAMIFEEWVDSGVSRDSNVVAMEVRGVCCPASSRSPSLLPLVHLATQLIASTLTFHIFSCQLLVREHKIIRRTCRALDRAGQGAAAAAAAQASSSRATGRCFLHGFSRAAVPRALLRGLGAVWWP
jgi:hypothetical protein